MHYKGLTEERACFLYRQDRIPDILVALPVGLTMRKFFQRGYHPAVTSHHVVGEAERPQLSGQHAEAVTAGFALSSCQLFANRHLMSVRVKVSVWDYSVSCHIVLSTACALTRGKLCWHTASWQQQKCHELVRLAKSSTCHAESALQTCWNVSAGKGQG